jgi:GGDEF-like domain/PucR C-terminal helix-turn-helix domain
VSPTPARTARSEPSRSRSRQHAEKARRAPSAALVIEQDARRIEGLLAGDLLDEAGLTYDFDLHHLGVVAVGAGAVTAIEDAAASSGRRSLVSRPRRGTVWAWLGSESELDASDLEALLSHRWPTGVVLGLGEPARGQEGWRLTHRQARAALSVARRGGDTIARYADVALLASILKDELLATSLRRLYIEPLEEGRDGGEALRQALRAYFSAGRNVSVAAGALGVTRQAVARRLRAAEGRIGRPIGDCAFELEAALRFEELTSAAV